MVLTSAKMFIRGKSGSTREIMLDLNLSFDSGGEGDLYRDPTNPNLAIKIFKQPSSLKEEKLIAMMANPPQIFQPTQSGGTVVCLSWPEGMIYDSLGKFMGYSMPYLDKSNMVKLTEILNQKLREKKDLRGNSETDYKFRIVTAINLANVLQYLHSCGHSVVDLKPDNILVHKTMGFVSFLDCDSFRIQAKGKIFPANVGTPEYLAPDCHDITKADIFTDLFALGVILSQIINNDLHPSTGTVIQPTGAPDNLVGKLSQGIVTVNALCIMIPHANSIETYLPKDIILMLQRALLAPPAQRPNASEWQAKLIDFLDNRLKECPKGIRAHTAFEGSCPWCDKSFNGMQRAAQPIAGTANSFQKQAASSAAKIITIYQQLHTKLLNINFSSTTALPSWVMHYWLALSIASLGTVTRYFLDAMGTDETQHQLRWIQACINFPAAAAIGAWLVDLLTRKMLNKKSASLNIQLRLGLLALTYLMISIISIDFLSLSTGYYFEKPLSLLNPFDILESYMSLFKEAEVEFIIYASCLTLLYIGMKPPSFFNRDNLTGFTYALIGASFFYIAYMSVSEFIQLKDAQIKKQMGELITIPAGSFVMGSSSGDQVPKHPVTIRSFRLMKTEVTFEQYDAFAKATGRDLPNDEGWGRGNRPVINVTWVDAQAYAQWVSQLSKSHLRLPSESEWEYAARAGTTTNYWWGNNITPNHAHYDQNSITGTALVGSYPLNPWGLYDMEGNVSEWVEASSIWDNYRVIRGGSLYHKADGLILTYRMSAAEYSRHASVGFRLAQDIK